MTKQFFSFFFTHLKQFVSTNTTVIQAWIEPERSSSFLAPETLEQNSLNLIVSNYQPVGQIDIAAATANFVLDVSSTIHLNEDWLTADRTVQPITNFNTNLQTPLLSPQANRSFIYAAPQVSFNKSYPNSYEVTVADGVYPFQTIQQEIYTENLVLVEPVAYRDIPVLDDQIVYQLLTVDDATITIDQTTIPDDISNASLTADRTGTEKLAKDAEVELDQQPSDTGSERLVVTGMPEANILVTWTSEDYINSQVVYPSFNRGYTPASVIGSSMPGATLKEIALSLLTLIEFDNEVLVLSVLTELTHIWTTNLGNVVAGELATDIIPGLPTYISRQYPVVQALSTQRDTLQIAWIGLALTKAVQYLRGRPTTSIRTLPTYFDLMLLQLGEVVANSLDTTGEAYVGFDEYGFLIDEPSLAATVVGQLFLQNYLTLSYHWNLHNAAAKMQHYLLGALNVRLEDTLTPDAAPVYKLLWNCVHNRHFDTESLITQIVDIHAAEPLSDFDVGLWIYILNYLPDTYAGVNYAALAQTFYQIGSDLYERKVSYQPLIPSLICSSWQRLYQVEQYLLCADLQFDLFEVEAAGFQTYLYNEAKRMMPYGYQWMSEDSLTAGKFGALLKAIAQLGYSWGLLLALIRAGQNLSTAQGDPLDQWGESLNVSRPLLQPDNFHRSLLLTILNLITKQGTVEAIQVLASAYGLSVELVEPQPTAVTVADEIIPWEEVSTSLLDALPEAAQFTTLRDYYPSSERLALGLWRTAVWEDIVPAVVVYTNDVSPDFTRQVLQSLPSSVPARFYARLTTETAIFTRARNL